MGVPTRLPPTLVSDPGYSVNALSRVRRKVATGILSHRLRSGCVLEDAGAFQREIDVEGVPVTEPSPSLTDESEMEGRDVVGRSGVTGSSARKEGSRTSSRSNASAEDSDS